MKTPWPTPTAFAPALAWFELWTKVGETMWASSQVIAHRTELMRKAGATPSAADRREMHLMGAEKVDAFSQAALSGMQGLAALAPSTAWDAGLRAMRAAAPMASLASSTSWPQWAARQAEMWRTLMPGPRSSARMATQLATLSSSTLKPVHAKATANARRLGAKPRRAR